MEYLATGDEIDKKARRCLNDLLNGDVTIREHFATSDDLVILQRVLQYFLSHFEDLRQTTAIGTAGLGDARRHLQSSLPSVLDRIKKETARAVNERRLSLAEARDTADKVRALR
jgi:hypothetical protein